MMSQNNDQSSRPDDVASWTTQDVADFYDTEIAAWQVILGPTMHYSFGTRDPNADPQDAEAHLNNTVRSLYSWIPSGANILDAGCGWGGPARLLARERNARVHGVTISKSQTKFIKTTIPDMTCTCQDLADLDLSENFDVTIALESLTHVDRPTDALRRIREKTDRIIIRDHVSEKASIVLDHWHMRVPSIKEMHRLVEQAGFRIEHEECVDVPWECVSAFWLNNLKHAFPVFTPEGQFSILEATCRQIVHSGPPPQKIHLILAS